MVLQLFVEIFALTTFEKSEGSLVMKKRICVISLVLCIFLLGTGAVSCKTKLMFWYSLGGHNGTVIESLVEDFNNSQSDILVEAQYMGNHTEIVQKLLASIAGNATPHVSTLGQRQGIPQIYDSGVLYSIDELTQRYGGLDMDDLVPGFVQRFTYRDRLVALPFANSTPALHYNRDLFEEAGLDPNEAPETWEELIEYANKLTKDTDGDGRIDQWGFNTAADTPWYVYALIGQIEGKMMDDNWNPLFNSEKGVQVVEFWSDLVHEHKVMPELMHPHVEQDFVTGKLAMLFNSIGSTGSFASQIGDSFDYGVAPLPGNLTKSVPVGGAGIGVFKSSPKEEEASWEFVRWLLSPDIMARWAVETGYVPVTYSSTHTSTIQNHIASNPNASVGIEQLDYVAAEGVNPADFEVWSGITSILEQVEADPNANIKRLLDGLADQVSIYVKQYQN